MVQPADDVEEKQYEATDNLLTEKDKNVAVKFKNGAQSAV